MTLALTLYTPLPFHKHQPYLERINSPGFSGRCFWQSVIEPQNDRAVWVGRDLKKHLVPTPPALGRDFTHFTQGLVQSGLEHLQGGGIGYFSGQSSPNITTFSILS